MKKILNLLFILLTFLIVGCVPNEELESSIPYITFNAKSEQKIVFYGPNSEFEMEYSVGEGEWESWHNFLMPISFGGNKGSLRLRGKNPEGTNGYSFVFKNKDVFVTCTGDIRTLIDYKNYRTTNTSKANFSALFMNCDVLASAPDLPITKLSEGCYARMFWGCKNLPRIPKLPAKKLTTNCYESMFAYCTGLIVTPELPATTLAESCYKEMFTYCKRLTTMPKLPATKLAENCYEGMFAGCAALTNVQELPATVLTEKCYADMFKGCTSLETAPKLSAKILGDFCCFRMFENCIALKQSPILHAKEIFLSCYSHMFIGCSQLSEVTILATKSYSGWNLFTLPSWLDNAGSEATTRTIYVANEEVAKYIKDCCPENPDWKSGIKVI